MEGPTSVYNSKRAFIESQVRVLSEPLRPSREWTEEYPEFAREKAVERALMKVHIMQRRHLREVYSSQAIHQVASQVDKLHQEKYLVATTGSSTIAGTATSPLRAVMSGEIALTEPEAIEVLPETWEEAAGPSTDNDPEDLARYEKLRDELLSLSSALSNAQQRDAQVSEIHSLVKMFTDPVPNVQQNLVYRDGEIEQELARMRVLLARVGARLPQALATQES
ncbi:kinetochore Sim4 complex subunit Fta4 [Myxozyma melibiosi]|uniref:Kinetochore Sim4 complex subunit Fta4 n=1 Tax=Myxozyma melibiosi TaxID=54550 RepID=A0ABR1F1H3_9ASCO